MKEIGGYIEIETNPGPALHEELLGLNCGRNCLAYLIEARGIRSIVLPYFLCSSVIELCERYQLHIRYYHLTKSLVPEELTLDGDEWLYLVNVYGQLDPETIRGLVRRYGRVIVDQVQAYFEEPLPGVDTIYTARKFFGVPDGAFLATDARLLRELETDVSWDRMSFLLGRFEESASSHYADYSANNRRFAGEPIKKMSRLTLNLLRGVDYGEVKRRREENFAYLDERLGGVNLLRVRRVPGPFVYPFMAENGPELRKKLIEKKIYIPVFWPNVPEQTEEGSWERRLAESVLPLPCDQRYNKDDMDRICEAVFQELRVNGSGR